MWDKEGIDLTLIQQLGTMLASVGLDHVHSRTFQLPVGAGHSERTSGSIGKNGSLAMHVGEELPRSP